MAYNSSTRIAPDFDAGRFGGGAIFLNESGEGRISTTFAAAATIIVDAALWPENATSNGSEEPIIELFDSGGTLQLYVTYLDNDGRLRAYRGDGTLLATSNTAWPLQKWRYVEVKVTVNDASGYVELRLDGVSVATFSGDTAAARVASGWSPPCPRDIGRRPPSSPACGRAASLRPSSSTVR